MSKIYSKSDILILSAYDINFEILKDYYIKMYPTRISSLIYNWKWLNRSYFYNYKIPLVLVLKDRVIGHAGMIPIYISFNNEIYTASWFIDYSVLPEFQRKGLGSCLGKKWMEFSDLQLAISCNEMSMGAFKKLGWAESSDTYLHVNFISPFNHPFFIKRFPSFLRKILNYFSNPFLFIIYKRYSSSNIDCHLEVLNEKSLNNFVNLYNKSKSKNISESAVSPIRDMDFIKWRILNSPNKNKYFIFSIEGFSAIILLNDNQGKYIDILWVSDINKYLSIRNMISSLAFYGKKRKYSYIRFYTSKKKLSDYIKKTTKSVVRHPRFALYSKNANLLNKIKNLDWNWELIDNDFERMK